MPDEERPKPDNPQDSLRQGAYKEEAAAVQEDLVTYILKSAAAQQFREELGRLSRVGLTELIRQVLSEDGFQPNVDSLKVSDEIADLRKAITVLDDHMLQVLEKLRNPQTQRPESNPPPEAAPYLDSTTASEASPQLSPQSLTASTITLIPQAPPTPTLPSAREQRLQSSESGATQRRDNGHIYTRSQLEATLQRFIPRLLIAAAAVLAILLFMSIFR